MIKRCREIFRVLLSILCGVWLTVLALAMVQVAWAQGPTGLDVILLIDSSESMSKPSGNQAPSDPQQLRVRAAQFLVDYLRANAATLGLTARAGIVTFGGTISTTVLLQPLVDDSVRNRIQPEIIPYTEFAKPLSFAVSQLRSDKNATSKKVVILLTDGEPALQGTNLELASQATNPDLPQFEAYFKSLKTIVDGMQSIDGRLYVLALGDAHRFGTYWTSLSCGYPISPTANWPPCDYYKPITGTTNLETIYRQLIADLLGLQPGPTTEMPSGKAVTITIEPYLEEVSLSLFNRDGLPISVSLKDPKGMPVLPTSSGPNGDYQIFTILDPIAGNWTAYREGEGNVGYSVEKKYPDFQVSIDPEAAFVGQSVTVTVQLFRGRDPVTASLPLTLQISSSKVPTNSTILLSQRGDGLYEGRLDGLQATGPYTISSNILLAGHPVTSFTPNAFRVFSRTDPSPATSLTPIPTLTPVQTPSVPPSPTPVLAGLATPTPVTSNSGGQVNAAILFIVIIIVIIVLAWRYKWNRDRKLRRLEEVAIEYRDSDKEWKPEDINEVIHGLRDFQDNHLKPLSPLINTLSELVAHNLEDHKNVKLKNDLNEQARTGLQAAQFILALAFLKFSISNRDLEIIYTEKDCFMWPDVLEKVIENRRNSEKGNQSNGLPMTSGDKIEEYILDIWKIFLSAVQPEKGPVRRSEQVSDLLNKLKNLLDEIEKENLIQIPPSIATSFSLQREMYVYYNQLRMLFSSKVVDECQTNFRFPDFSELSRTNKVGENILQQFFNIRNQKKKGLSINDLNEKRKTLKNDIDARWKSKELLPMDYYIYEELLGHDPWILK